MLTCPCVSCGPGFPWCGVGVCVCLCWEFCGASLLSSPVADSRSTRLGHGDARHAGYPDVPSLVVLVVWLCPLGFVVVSLCVCVCVPCGVLGIPDCCSILYCGRVWLRGGEKLGDWGMWSVRMHDACCMCAPMPVDVVLCCMCTLTDAARVNAVARVRVNVLCL